MRKKSIVATTAIVSAVLVLVLILAFFLHRKPLISIGNSGQISLTPVEIVHIKDIGQWEFLTISDEEIVDTVRHGLFGDYELSRIYYGTLRLGADLSRAKKDFITTDHDTIIVKLPPIQLLDERFIDEARTRSFIEDGSWTEADRAALTRKAIRRMRQRCLTTDNIRKAEINAQQQVSTLLHTMGYQHVKVIVK